MALLVHSRGQGIPAVRWTVRVTHTSSLLCGVMIINTHTHTRWLLIHLTFSFLFWLIVFYLSDVTIRLLGHFYAAAQSGSTASHCRLWTWHRNMDHDVCERFPSLSHGSESVWGNYRLPGPSGPKHAQCWDRTSLLPEIIMVVGHLPHVHSYMK